MTTKFKIKKETIAGTKSSEMIELAGGCSAVWMQPINIVEPKHRRDKRRLRPRTGKSMRATTKGN